MESGTSSFTRRSQVFLLAVVAFFIMVAVAAAQQPTTPGGEGNAADVAPLKTPAQAAINPSTPSSMTPASITPAPVTPGKTDDTATNSDQFSAIKLGPGDLIEVNVYNVPELTSKVRVSNAGDIYLPLIDYVHVEGLTDEEAQTLIEKRLADGGFVRNPHVTIFVDDAASQGVTVLGEVQKPGIYPDVADHKLYEVISQAGGFSQTASRKIAILRRNQPDPIRVELPRNLADDVSANVEIMPGDTITIPRAPIIYVVGDVGHPAGLLVDNGQLTVLQALALAGGPNHTAKLGAARIIRKGPTGMTETKIAVKKMLEAKAPDVALQADDILFIPVSGARVLAASSFQAAMAATSGVLIYSVHP